MTHWPILLKLVQLQVTYFNNADLLLVANCVPFAMGIFYNKFLKSYNLVVGYPRLDSSRFCIEKLKQILGMSKLNSLAVVQMEVSCCRGLTHIAKEAIANSKTKIVCEDFTIDLRGNVIKTETISL